MEDSLRKLSEIQCLSDEIHKSLKENSPDNNGMVFADLGRFLCKNFQKIRKEEKEEIFMKIEALVSSDNEKNQHGCCYNAFGSIHELLDKIQLWSRISRFFRS